MAIDELVRERLEWAVRWVQAAGGHTLRYFQQPRLDVERKSDNSPVTIADREAEQLLRRLILERFPADAILGEEFGAQDGSSGFRWILDPIDGTKSFIAGVPLYSTLVGIERDGEPVAGVIGLPALDEVAFAARGGGAFAQRGEAVAVPIHVSRRQRLADAIFVTSQVDSFAKRGALEAYRRLEKEAYVTRTWGDAYGYFLVATGRADIMIDPIMNLWDAAAILPIVAEAGGVFTDWQGRPVITSGEGVAANRELIEEVLAVTRDFAAPR